MPTAEWTPQAETDLEQIVYFISIESGRPSVAKKLALKIREKCEQYARHPLMGTARPDLGEEIRSFSHKRYVVLYVPAEHGIEVRAVVDGARDFDTLFGDD